MIDAPAQDAATRLCDAARALSGACATLRFAPPVAHVYNPLDYAWAPYEAYLRRYGNGRRRVVFLGMNPGPFGMMQTGVPFGEVAAVRDWMGIEAPVRAPALEHPKRRIEGFTCPRSEVSGRRLWGWAAERFGSAPRFFGECFVLNYCPLVFLEASGRNRTPEQMPSAETAPLYEACDRHLRAAIDALEPDWAIGIGGFAARRLESALGARSSTRIAQVLHPSPASPAANRGWAQAVDRTLAELGVFPRDDAAPRR
jgi:single-strand selective monofunctional uracil DNA glycosylase